MFIIAWVIPPQLGPGTLDENEQKKTVENSQNNSITQIHFNFGKYFTLFQWN